MKLKKKHFELGRHFIRFIDRKRFPDFILSNSTLETFIKIESNGTSGITKCDIKECEPLLNAKMIKELTIRMLWEEMSELWSNGNGWFYPIAHTIQEEFRNRSNDKIYLRCLIKIMRSIRRDGFVSSLRKYTGIPDEVKDVMIDRFFDGCCSQIRSLRLDER